MHSVSLRAKRAARERASSEAARGQGKERPQLSRLLSRACRASTFHNILQMENLLAGSCSARQL